MTEKQAALFEQRRLAVSEEARLNPIPLMGEGRLG